ncbi:hypothetical protein DICPUDRAFT_149379 [Dictyostelium purpureum]|uniref:Poly [ADP-ribose] polymerase n=1 Tax=Dictyostelium purpureum TaxID=5786 RepID=F0ZDJ8_DICPU|nr:uncharacterized protein DICPUDRAFT_149379 [Dictyostelium purpureum]EGC37994.1 hypothetical protein DICPUDRAFT_149379 [Dictyostelium purpureum]|eukprot:XP_003285478.1 hypothetical protein DICPUDRAFT_149379 [Dictyostelium purpureum]
MPPKKKPTTTTNFVQQSSSSNIAIPATINLANSTNSTNTSTSATASTAQKKIQWYWAGDSNNSTGSVQDILIEYDSKINSEIESQFQQFQLKPKSIKLSKFKVDNDRYINFKTMCQTRYDDPNKNRSVERKEIIPGTAPTAPSVSIKGRDKPKKRKSTDSDSESDSDSDSSDSDSSDSDISSDSDSDDEDYIAKWYWAGDSNGGPSKGGGHQDVWVEYDNKMCKNLEKAFQNNDKKYKVDKERFVDLQNMLQRRCDDESKRRNVKREDPKKTKKAKKSNVSTAQQINNAINAVASSHGTTSTAVAPITKNASSKSISDTTTTTTTTAVSNNKATLAPTMSQISISSIIKCPDTWTNVDSMDYKEIDIKPSESEFKWMSKLFTNTIAPIHKGMATLSPIVFNDLVVSRVTRIQNPMQWVRYHGRKQKILDDNKGKCSPIYSVLTDVSTGPEVDRNANEFFLFHGLNISSITGIAKFGFDPRFCSLEGMYGAGLYFAENSSKSNQYCHGKSCTASGFLSSSCHCSAKDEICILVCRVTLGDALVENVYRGNTKGSFWHGRRTEPKKPDGVSIYNSVVGESKPNYGPKAALQLREYIVYESSQVYSEYKVYFHRKK